VTFSKLAIFVITAALASAGAQAAAQQNPDSTRTPSGASTSNPSTTSAAAPASEADDPATLIAKANAAAAATAKAVEIPPNTAVVAHEPTAAARKKAADFGFHSEMYSGKTFFCKDDATVGTRIASKKCIDPDNFEDYAIQMQIARDTMPKDVCQGGKESLNANPCGGMGDKFH
jgi:ABC-type transport system substrate-binding protein